MKVYAPETDSGRTRAVDDVHHRTADQPRADCKRSAKPLRKAARQYQKRLIREQVSE